MAISYPIRYLNPVVKANENRMVGTNDMPPRRGIIPLWTFRSSGMSNNFFRKATTRILGIISADRTIDISREIAMNI